MATYDRRSPTRISFRSSINRCSRHGAAVGRKNLEAAATISTRVNARAASKAVRKYLAAYAEDSAQSGAHLAQRFAQVVVIPAYGEDEVLDRAIASIPNPEHGSALAVVVINAREDSPAAVKAINQATSTRLRARYCEHRWLNDDTLLCQAPFGALALIHVTLPRGQGVGLARKHGADLALGAWAAGLIDSSWIHCTDADVQLPNDYFCTPHQSATVALHRFRHETTELATRAHARTYDLWLRLHVLGLHWAGSPYGFHTIGSTITVDAHSYAVVRGFPRRNAAEDFYFLNKLAKIGTVITAASAPLRIAARISDRVPFGTGAAIGLAQREGSGALPRFYHPSTYLYLRTTLNALQASSATGHFERHSLQQSLRQQGLDPAPADAAMDALGFTAAVDKLLHASTVPQQRRRALHCWFDAFRTMKFIHHVRDNGVASVDARSALAAGQFLLGQQQPEVADDIRVVRGVLANAASIIEPRSTC
ncbi:MAG: hypothetical protein ACI8W7_004273 [Gammaproteobacteria bacterium]